MSAAPVLVDGDLKVDSGPTMTPARMVKAVQQLVTGWSYDRVSIGYPGPVVHGRIAAEPVNLGRGWVRFDFEKALGHPVRIVNDAAMQALGSYKGGRMLFLGLGTGLGSAMIVDGDLQPMELAHLPMKNGRTYEGLHRGAGAAATRQAQVAQARSRGHHPLARSPAARLRGHGRRQREEARATASRGLPGRQRQRVRRRLSPLEGRSLEGGRAALHIAGCVTADAIEGLTQFLRTVRWVPRLRSGRPPPSGSACAEVP